jgi:hypothetical protein
LIGPSPVDRSRKLHADKAYGQRDLREWVRDRGIGARIARKGIESSGTTVALAHSPDFFARSARSELGDTSGHAGVPPESHATRLRRLAVRGRRSMSGAAMVRASRPGGAQEELHGAQR